jgi:diadenosine tetraphosphatase ApaH/serine/threonine PP2A family protein phosphatase
MLICLGDMVGYGPEPGACVRRILDEADLVLRGNHDHSLATGAGIGSPPMFEWVAEATADLGRAQLSEIERRTLATLPLRSSLSFDLCPYHLVHATPTDPMYRHLEPTSPHWAREVLEIGPEVLIVGHSHLQFRHHVGGRTIISPGSVGQPRHGDCRAAYMIIEGGNFMFCRVAYEVERTVEALERSGIEAAAAAVLVQLLRTGRPSLYISREASAPPSLTRSPGSMLRPGDEKSSVEHGLRAGAAVAGVSEGYRREVMLPR